MGAQQRGHLGMGVGVLAASLLAQPMGVMFREHFVRRQNPFGAQLLLGQPVAQAVEGAAADVGLEGELAPDPLAHVAGRLVGVGEHEDPGSGQRLVLDEMRDSLRQGFRLAGAGPRQDEKAPARAGDRRQLGRIQFHKSRCCSARFQPAADVRVWA